MQRIVCPTFVGRTEEFAGIVRALKQVAEGGKAVVLVRGEAGVGKTRAAEEVHRRARAMGFRVLAGACVDVAGLPLAALRDAISWLDVPGSTRLYLALHQRLTGVPTGGQAGLFDLLVDTLDELTRDTPVLFSVDDAHWADQSTLEALHVIVRASRPQRLLVLVTYRREEMHLRPEVSRSLAELHRLPHAQAVTLEPFSPRELSEQVDGIQGPTEKGFLAELHRLSGGNAFFAEELLAANWRPGELPVTVADVILARTASLPLLSQDLLQLACVIGDEIDDQVLLSASSHPTAQTDAGIRDAESGGMLTRSGRGYRFRHALTREALYRDLPPGRRRDLHYAVATAIESTARPRNDAVTLAALARHWTEAHDIRRALPASIAAGTAAADFGAAPEAQFQYEHALDLWLSIEDPPGAAGMTHTELLRRCAEMAHLSGNGERALELITAARAEVDEHLQPLVAGVIQARLADYLFEAGRGRASVEADAEARRILRLAGPSTELAQALRMQARVLNIQGHWRAALPGCEEAAQMASISGAREEEQAARWEHASTLAVLGVQSAVPLLCRILDGFEADDIVSERRYEFISDMLEVRSFLGQPDEALATARSALDLVDASRPNARTLKMLLGSIARSFLETGHWDQALLVAQSCVQIDGPPILHDTARAVLAELFLARGQLSAAASEIAALERGQSNNISADTVARLCSLKTQFALLDNKPDLALAETETGVAALSETDLAPFAAWLCALGLRAVADFTSTSRSKTPQLDNLHRRAELLLAEARRRTAAPVIEGAPLLPTLAAAALAEAEFDRLHRRRAAAKWQTAAEQWEALRNPMPLAYSQMRWAAALIASNKRDRASHILRRASDTAIEHDAAPLRLTIAELARRARLDLQAGQPSPPPQRPSLARFGLTPREVEVLELMSRGLTDAEIAANLFISPRTAGVHVSHILTKLNVPNRGHAAAVYAASIHHGRAQAYAAPPWRSSVITPVQAD